MENKGAEWLLAARTGESAPEKKRQRWSGRARQEQTKSLPSVLDMNDV
ncbi:hypothetical protein SETIT_8G130100v2 [Setaria italica]|uniref:Uncharacterized protein n=2 Tax=Setaria TaxID=4554 RepID=A0A368S783_SETIT|nr:hypothetical protein SETIT_8G130100v2 [Setaria italica]TKW00824.1 hypothetical protein SEVIR_8G137500v2 [Setaria viridis]